MMLATRFPLPLGRIAPIFAKGGRRIVIQDPTRGEYRGPFVVLREVTAADYWTWFEADTGRSVQKPERHRLTPKRYKFYEISLD